MQSLFKSQMTPNTLSVVLF